MSLSPTVEHPAIVSQRQGSSNGTIRKFNPIPPNLRRYLGADRDVNLFQLNSQLEDGAIDLLPEVFVEQRHVHILGIGPVFCLRNEMGSSGWCVPLSTSGQRHNSKDGGIEQMPSTVEKNS